MSNQTGFRQGRLGIGKNPIFPLDISGSTRIEGDLILGGTIADINGTPIEFGAATATFNVGTNIVDPHITSSQVPSWSSNVTVEAGANTLNDLSDALVENNSIWLGSNPNSTTNTAEGNVAVGYQALDSITTGDYNVASGFQALTANLGGGDNVAIGRGALEANTSGNNNVALGSSSLGKNIDGYNNVAFGLGALYNTTTGYNNIGLGYQAGNTISTGHSNTIIGWDADTSSSVSFNEIVIGKSAVGHGSNTAVIGDGAITAWHPADDNGVDLGSTSYSFKNIYFDGTLYQNGVEFGGGVFNGVQYINGATLSIYISGDDNTHANATGDGNVAIGEEAMMSATGAASNVGIGKAALSSLTSGYENVSVGKSAGWGLTNGKRNVAIGKSALNYNGGGDANVAIGHSALNQGGSGNYNVGIGYLALEKTGAHYNIGLGSYAGMYNSGGNMNISIGYYSGPTAGQTNLHNRLYIDVVSARRGTSSFIYGHMDETNPILVFNANVGIGTTDPDELLHVENTGGEAKIKIQGSSDSAVLTLTSNSNSNYIFTNTVGDLYLRTDGSKLLLADTGGNVGIGTPTPSSTLHVISTNIFDGIKVRYSASNPAGVYIGYGGISSVNTSRLRFGCNNTEKMCLDNNGRLGIGTTSPYCNLHIAKGTGNAVTATNIEDYYLLLGGNENVSNMHCRIAFGYVYDNTLKPPAYIGYQETSNASGTDGALVFGTRYGNPSAGTLAPTERMRIAADGEVTLFGADRWTHFNYSTNQDVYLRAGKTAGNVNINDNGGNVYLCEAASGRVGIGMVGVPSTNSKLQVAGNIGCGTWSSDGNTSMFCLANDTNWGMKFLHVGSTYYTRFGIHGYGNNNNRGFQFYDYNSNIVRMFINGAGRVGIGTTSPDGEGILTVNTSSNYHGIKLMNGTNQLCKLAKSESASAGYMYCYGTYPVNLNANSSSFISGKLAVGFNGTPSYPLHVAAINFPFSYYGYLNADGASGSDGYNTGQTGWGIYCNKSIATETAFYVASDKRIKENIVDVPDNLALQMVRDIPCRYYEYKDKLEKGEEKAIGFIAQEVMEVLPMAVSITTNIIPNEMRKLENISWEEFVDNSNNKYKLTTDLQDVSGIKYRFYVSNDPSGNDEINKELIGNEDGTFTFDKEYENVFCYGKEIDDFHSLDKAKIFSLHHSAIQEIDRKQLEDEATIIAQAATIASLESELAAIKIHLGL